MKDYQLHKIMGVAKEVCTAEQMIAYNYAFTYYQDKHISAATIAQWIIKRNAGDTRYNWVAVAHLINIHLDKYRAAKYHILNSYEEVGKMFPVKIDYTN